MGPQLYRCGNTVTVPANVSDVGLLQWGRNFIVAETRLAQTRKPLVMDRRFNGAATLSLRKRRDKRGMPAPHNGFNGAATLSLRKRLPTPATMTGAPMCFNGAATLSLRKPADLKIAKDHAAGLQWGRNFIVAETPHPRQVPAPVRVQRFNGAATLSLRKPKGINRNSSVS